MVRFLLFFALPACTFITEAQLERQLDQDGDGVEYDEDCAPDDPDRGDLVEGFADTDGDGFGGQAIVVCGALDGVTQLPVGGDCNDEDAAISPVADERCNGIDDDCDGVFDSDDPGLIDGTAYYVDFDGDGSPAPGGEALIRCEAPAGRAIAPQSGIWDCDDENDAIGPSSTEICDGIDNDCIGGIDNGLEPLTAYVDTDDDGFGTTADVIVDCLVPAGFVTNPDDCDDTDPDISPAAAEVCDGIDNDCVDGIDDGLHQLTSYADADLDGFGSIAEVIVDCLVPSGFVGNPDDCDDHDSAVSPAAAEVCATAIDEDCDGEVDEEGGALLRFRDADLDGYSDGDSAMLCALPGPGWLDAFDPAFTDCDDEDSSRFPGAPDVAYDGVDSDCDGADDYDADGDGFQRQPEGADCDDTDPATYPGAPDAPYDGVDRDCAGDNDDDADGDGFTALAQGGGDCDDDDPAIRPDAAEHFYDGIDQDCDGADDYDADGDGYVPDAYAGLSALPTGDCDDAESTVFPGATDEAYDGIDSDCLEDNDYDVDGDGHVPPAYTSVGLPADDCNDAVPDIYGGADEICNGIDDDCDGTSDEPGATGPSALQAFLDADLDGSPSGTIQTVCAFVPGFVDPSLNLVSDCDDADPSSFPGAVEIPDDGIDQDCDGPDAVLCFEDLDLDGAGGSFLVFEPLGSCDGVGLASASTDCDDDDDESYPGAPELCDLIDQDCDGIVATDLISARLTGGGAGVVLWPGPLETAAGLDLSGYDQVSVCGPGPWPLPPMFSTQGLLLEGVTTPAPTLEFSGSQSALDVAQISPNNDPVILHNLRFTTPGRTPTDAPVVRVAEADSVTLTGVEFDGVSGSAAVELSGWFTARITGGRFAHGTHSAAPVVTTLTDLTVVNGTTFTGNAGGEAGGIAATHSALHLSWIPFVGNTSTGVGGALTLRGGSTADGGSFFFSNTAVEGGAIYVGPQAVLTGEDFDFSYNSADRGGALLVHGSADLDNSFYSENTATGDGGAILLEPCDTSGPCAESNNPQPTLVLTGGNSNDNSAADGGLLLVDSGVARLSSVSAVRNTAVSRGGTIYVREVGVLTVASGTFEDGSADEGGAIAVDDAIATFSEVDIRNNTANSGGGLFGDSEAFVLMDDTLIESNTSTGHGGGVDLQFGQLSIRNSFVTENTAGQSGGGVRANTVVCSATTFSLNQSVTAGGGVAATRFDGTGAQFFDNSAGTGLGGGLKAGSGTCNYFCGFIGNSARLGGGIWSSTFQLDDALVELNTAHLAGGGLYGQVTAYFSTFRDNVAGDRGGATFIQSDQVLNPQGNVYETNSAPRGGAVFIYSGNSSEYLSSFLGNSADEGAALYLQNSQFTDSNSLFSQNVAAVAGDVAYLAGSESEFAMNNSAVDGGSVFLDGPGTTHPLTSAPTVSVVCSDTTCTCSPTGCPAL